MKKYYAVFLIGSVVLTILAFWLGSFIAQAYFHASDVQVWGAGACAAIIPIVISAFFNAAFQIGFDSEKDEVK